MNTEMLMSLFVLAGLGTLSGCHSSTPTPDGGTNPSKVTLQTVVVQPGVETAQNVDWVAAQDGTGAWTQLTGTAGSYTFDVADAEGRYSVVVVCPSSGGSRIVEVLQNTTAELSSIRTGCTSPAATVLVDVNATSTNWDGAAVSATAYLGSNGFNMPAQNVASTTHSIPPGIYDSLTYTSDASSHVLKMLVNHGTEISGAAHLSFNFNGSISPTSASYTLSGLTGSETGSASVSLYTANASAINLPSTGSSPSFLFTLVPAGLLDPADVHLLSFGAASGTTSRVALSTAHSPTGGIVTPPVGFTAVNVSSFSSTPIVRAKADWTGGLPHAGVVFAMSQTPIQWIVFSSVGYQASQTTLTTPDPSAAAGWDSVWALQAGIMASDVVIAYTGDDSILRTILPAPIKGMASGLSINADQASGNFMP